MAIAAESGGKAVDGRIALSKLTGGQALSDAEKKYLGLSTAAATPTAQGKTPAPTVTPKALKEKIDNKDGTFTLVYDDGSREVLGSKTSATTTTTATDSGSLTAERVYAKDTFVNTLKLTFGAKEAAQPYVTKLYDLVSGFYKSGSTEDEALNLAVREAKMNNSIPEFTKRFQGIFDLEDQLKAGKAVQVPTIAEFFAAEAKMGEVLTNAGLGDLANQEFLGGIIGKGKSVLEVGNLISDVFNTIDNAPTALKTDLQTYFPGVDRTSIAKALLTGPAGAAELSQKIKGYSVKSAFGTQGLNVDLNTAQDIANMGYDYNQALTGAGQVSQGLPTFEKLQEMRLGTDVKTTDAQAMLQNSIFGKNAAAQAAIDKAAQEEANRFKASSGIAGSKSLASQSRAAGLI
jgi:hypothetical protein